MKALNSGDFVRTDVETHKQFTLSETSSLLIYAQGQKQIGTFFTESAPTTTNGLFKGPLFGTIKSQFYSEQYRDETTQSFHTTASIIQLSQTVFDEKIKEGSVSLVSGSNTFIDDENGNLVLSGSGTHVGNVFYENGAIVITDTGSFVNLGSGSFQLTFRGTHIKTTLEITATIQPNEFNTSTNPTAILNGKKTLVRPRFSYNIADVSASYNETITSQSIIPEFFGFGPSGSADTRLNPYVTTIGYYNDDLELLAVAKVATSTPIPTDFPITFRSRIDI